MASQGGQGTRGAAGLCVFVSVKAELLELPPPSVQLLQIRAPVFSAHSVLKCPDGDDGL